MSEVRTVTRPMRQQCRCGMSQATQVLTYAGNYMVTDRSTCDGCGATLWDWTWASSMLAAQAAREAVAARNGLDSQAVDVRERLGTPLKMRRQFSLW